MGDVGESSTFGRIKYCVFPLHVHILFTCINADIATTILRWSSTSSLVPRLLVPPRKNGLVNEVKFLGLIPQKW